LILEADSKAFPPRLPEQPLFYPVLNFTYAEQIARDWNTKDPNSGFAGFVTTFDIDKEYIDQFEEHIVGSSTHCELWIPAEQINQFNQHILGRIEIKAAYYGINYKGAKHWNNKNWYADELFNGLYQTWLHSGQDFSGEMTRNCNAILLNYGYWLQKGWSEYVLSEKHKLGLLRAIKQHWQDKFPDIHLFGSEVID
jgi:hypothetical protein